MVAASRGLVEDGSHAPDSPGVGRFAFASLTVAGLASLGSGAIHAAAVGVHSEHRQAVWTFVFVAAFQIAWGVLALMRPGRMLAAVGVAGNAALIAGWLFAKTTGLGFIAGMERAEEIQVADAFAAGLALVAVLGALAPLLDHRAGREPQPPHPALRSLSAIALAAVTIPGMISAGSHTHAAHERGETEAAAALRSTASAGLDHSHATTTPTAVTTGPTATTVHDHTPAVVPPKPYDPTKPIDLSGVAGVTPEQQAAAENVIAVTLADLPKFSDPAVAERAGFHSIGDGFTGYEHYINWSYIDDDHVLDPDFPESLVYRIEGGSKKLVSAMFMLPSGTTLDDVPELGGPLTQWHIHDNLCFTDDPVAPRVAGVTSNNGPCNPPLVRKTPVPMIHVWIVPHPCGPFAALEGAGAGQIKPGEERLCDTAHGSGTS